MPPGFRRGQVLGTPGAGDIGHCDWLVWVLRTEPPSSASRQAASTPNHWPISQPLQENLQKYLIHKYIKMFKCASRNYGYPPVQDLNKTGLLNIPSQIGVGEGGVLGPYPSLRSLAVDGCQGKGGHFLRCCGHCSAGHTPVTNS